VTAGTYAERDRSRIPIDRQHLELLADLLGDLDDYVRRPFVAHALRIADSPGRRVDTDLLIDRVGFQALRLRQILDR
jgi:hypothetical protein